MARSKSKHRRVQNIIRQKWKRQLKRKAAAAKTAAAATKK